MTTDVKAQSLFLVGELLAVTPGPHWLQRRRINAGAGGAVAKQAELALLPVLLLPLGPFEHAAHVPEHLGPRQSQGVKGAPLHKTLQDFFVDLTRIEAFTQVEEGPKRSMLLTLLLLLPAADPPKAAKPDREKVIQGGRAVVDERGKAFRLERENERDIVLRLQEQLSFVWRPEGQWDGVAGDVAEEGSLRCIDPFSGGSLRVGESDACS